MREELQSERDDHKAEMTKMREEVKKWRRAAEGAGEVGREAAEVRGDGWDRWLRKYG